jgi:hypothetical protein
MQRLKIPKGEDKKGYLGEGDCSVNKDEIHKHEVQPEQQHQIDIPEYDEMCIILCFVDVYYTNNHFAHPLFEYMQRTPSWCGQMSWERGARHTLNLIH